MNKVNYNISLDVHLPDSDEEFCLITQEIFKGLTPEKEKFKCEYSINHKCYLFHKHLKWGETINNITHLDCQRCKECLEITNKEK